MANALLRSTYRIDAQVKTVYTGNGACVPQKKGKYIFTASDDKVLVLEYETGAVLASAYASHGEAVATICCSDDGAWLYASSKNLQGTLFRVHEDEFFEVSLKKEREWQPSRHPVSTCAFSPTPAASSAAADPETDEMLWLATACTDGAIRLFEPCTHSLTHTLQNDGGIIMKLAFTRTGGRVFMVATCFSGMVAVWDLETRVRVAVLNNHTSPVEGVEFFYNGGMMVTGGRDGLLNVYRLSVVDEAAAATNHPRKRKRGGAAPLQFDATNSHSFTVLEEISGVGRVTKALLGGDYGDVVDEPQVDKEIIVIGGETGRLRYFYLERTGRARKCKKEIGNSEVAPAAADATAAKGPALPRVVSIIPVPDAHEIMVATADHDLEFFNPLLQRQRLIVGKIDQVLDCRYGPEDEVVAASNSAAIRVFHTTSPFCELLTGHSDVVLTLSTSPCRKYLASAGKDRTVRVWDLPKRRCLAILTGHSSDVTAVRFACPVESSSAAPVLLSASADLSVKVWNLKDVMGGEKRYTRLQQQQGVPPDVPVTIESSPNNTTPRAHEQDISSIAVNPVSDTCATTSKDKTVRVWAIQGQKALKLLASLKGHRRRVHCCAFSTHEKLLASGAGDATVKLWGVGTGEGCLKTFQGHQNPVLSVVFINQGLQLISASSDGMLKVWAIKQHSCLATLSGHTQRIWNVEVDRTLNERQFLTCGGDGVINVWKDFTDEDKQQTEMKKALHVQQSQVLQDRMRKGEYSDALELCLKLDHPRDMKDAIIKLNTMGSAEEHLGTAIEAIKDDQEMMDRLLGYIRKWMLNALHADTASLTLRALMSTVHITHLANSDATRKNIEALLAYGTRHHDRMRQQLQDLHLIPLFCNQPPAVPPLANGH
eukprot:TRINITY_DN18208_c0_g1_i1.p1 TRINITY_DN18208_c0_g1~~TRINITY_DN18208_c0_g1_i1.p1  ORF type:complete len:882 (+),score=384.82 TRINITY_DN18208_c0_g1_i1:88-2733(+)